MAPVAHPGAQPPPAVASSRLETLPLRSRLTRRLFGLQDADVLPFRLSPGRVYILPTRAGLTLIALVAGMLLGSVNYGLAMGYLFTFLLLGLLASTLFATWRNVVGLTVLSAQAQPVFAGDPLSFHLRLDAGRGKARHAIGLALGDGQAAYVRLAAGDPCEVVLETLARRRGRQPMGMVRIFSEYPLGLFQAWALVQPKVWALVWPRPGGGPPLPDTGQGEAGDGQTRRRGTEDFDGLRAYERGEHPARIAWKSLARFEQALVKGFVSPRPQALWLTWEATRGLDAEARLSLLARWVLEADRRGLPYGLRLPGSSLAPGLGLAHRHRCLTALALMPLEGP